MKVIRLLFACALLLAIPTAIGASQAGGVDPDFGANGTVLTDLGSVEYPNGLLIQPDDKIVIAGRTAEKLFLARYSSDGALDSSFAGDGVAFGPNVFPADVRRQADGKILVIGAIYFAPDDETRAVIVRYHAHGQIDSSFGSAGIVSLTARSYWHAIDIQPDNRIVVAGHQYESALVARYLANGTLDNSFGGDGFAQLQSGGVRQLTGVAVLPDGRIQTMGQKGFARFLANGQNDTSLGGAGTSGEYKLDNLRAMIRQPDGKLLFTGDENDLDSDFILARRMPNVENRDTAFGSGGYVSTDLGGHEFINDFALQADGKIIAVGGSTKGGFSYAIARYLPNGALDKDFGNGGAVVTPVNTGRNQYLEDAALQKGGDVVVLGLGGTKADVFLSRYFSTGTTGTSETPDETAASASPAGSDSTQSGGTGSNEPGSEDDARQTSDRQRDRDSRASGATADSEQEDSVRGADPPFGKSAVQAEGDADETSLAISIVAVLVAAAASILVLATTLWGNLPMGLRLPGFRPPSG